MGVWLKATWHEGGRRQGWIESVNRLIRTPYISGDTRRMVRCCVQCDMFVDNGRRAREYAS